MINEATLIARIGKKDVKQTKNGSEMATLYVATSEKWKRPDGSSEETTTWHNVYFFSKLAEIVKNHCHVGNLVYIKGKINHQKIESGDKAGQYAYSLTGNAIKLLPGSKKTEDSGKLTNDNVRKDNNDFDDDIPFL